MSWEARMAARARLRAKGQDPAWQERKPKADAGCCMWWVFSEGRWVRGFTQHLDTR